MSFSSATDFGSQVSLLPCSTPQIFSHTAYHSGYYCLFLMKSSVLYMLLQYTVHWDAISSTNTVPGVQKHPFLYRSISFVSDV